MENPEKHGMTFSNYSKELSAAGEQYVNEEIKESLLRVKEVKEKMEKEEEKHIHLMEALRHSGDKKKGAMQLARETEQRLEEAEQQCRDLTKSFFGECRPCLEDSCKAFFTSTCRRGYTSFTLKVEDFFRKMASQFESTEQNSYKTSSAENQIKAEKIDTELNQAEASFTQLLSNISDLYNHSLTVVKKMQHVLGPSVLKALTLELQSNSFSAPQDGSGDGFFKSLGLDHILYTVFAYGKDVMEEFSSTVEDVFGEIQEADEYFHHSNRESPTFGQQPSGYLCRALRRQVSECWQLQKLCENCKNDLIKECPRLQQLHSEMEEMHTLLNASRLQYDNRLKLVHRHTMDTQRLFEDTKNEYTWLNLLVNVSGDQNNFRVIEVNLQQQLRTNSPGVDSSVVVSVFDSAPLTVQIPANLMLEDPAFIEYTAQQALTHYKQQIRGTHTVLYSMPES
ncbi:PREDICTED: clusterin-like protein 1 [Cyprinodon variegatus]|uniref:clusterin-like protein 1 n=1 Tax=Cyprinodon variegatus TaxID=28743 RepID=UPI000742C67C|nr:PREDICTED: clusterin-like protein 1 [Cyprinodon variegatus]